MEIFLLNVMGSAAVASAVLAGAISSRLSKELAGSARVGSDSCPKRPARSVFRSRP